MVSLIIPISCVSAVKLEEKQNLLPCKQTPNIYKQGICHSLIERCNMTSRPQYYSASPKQLIGGHVGFRNQSCGD